MSEFSRERLYPLLPSVYRARDEALGQPLRALLRVMEREVHAVEQDIEGLWNNWFIETCDEWVVPYVADLLGVAGLAVERSHGRSQRAYVANALGHRRRKGTVGVLEQISRDVAGWPALAVEFFKLVGTTEHVNHLRPESSGTADLRRSEMLELQRGPLDTAAHTLDVRNVEMRRGRYGISNLGLYVWRLDVYRVTRGQARPVGDPEDGTYTFDPWGHDAPLFNYPRGMPSPSPSTAEAALPGMLRRRPLYEELEARRRALARGESAPSVFFGPWPVFRIFLDRALDPVAPEEILICDLSRWSRPPATKNYEREDGTPVAATISAAVDPILGRLVFPQGATPREVRVDYTHAFSGDLGGGPYDRSGSVAEFLTREKRVDWQIAVAREMEPVEGEVVGTLAEAVREWKRQPAGSTGVIAVMDSSAYPETLEGPDTLVVPEGSELLVVAADWPQTLNVRSGQPERTTGHLEANGRRPQILGSIAVRGGAEEESARPGSLYVNGLFVEGSVTILPGNLGRLQLVHCTVKPGAGRIVTTEERPGEPQNAQLVVRLERSVCGPVFLTGGTHRVEMVDCIVDGGEEMAIDARGAFTALKGCTVLGAAAGLVLEASDTLFTGDVAVERRQTGFMRYCYVSAQTPTPRRYHCQPDHALEGMRESDRGAARERLRPVFTSTRFGHPAYGQLGENCAREIRTGAEDGSEMGAFGFLKQPQREAGLRRRLQEHVPFGMDIGLFYVT